MLGAVPTAPSARSVVYVIPVEGVIDLGLAPFVERVLDEAAVQIGLPGAPALPVEEKTVSCMRKEFRATAESRKRPPELAEAMVDADVDIPSVIAKGKLLTLTTGEALQHKLVDFRTDSLEAVLASLGLAETEVRRASETWAESVVHILTNPIGYGDAAVQVVDVGGGLHDDIHVEEFT